ncbi:MULTISPECIES: VOC family protein [unclassified Photobacterium]|uniref:VOC family protein n=1 Tax=unclassified Photobacterium TaxID=2628852 RepID=UPI000D160BF2|nr:MULTISPECIES: VOC family protein [unclassified Photobacterium]PSV44608.1 glyoxalase [Photobacterium sp. GB-36]PSV57129.1 glyoxalase [Photobacterium sp. GB-3]
MIDVDAMFPVMVTSDLEAVKQFYETAFGFNAVFYDSNFYLHLVSPNNNIQLGFLLPNVASQPEFLHPIMSSKGYVISLEVKDATFAYAEAKQMDLNLIMALKEEEWGQVHFMIQDPAGLSIDVVQHL